MIEINLLPGAKHKRGGRGIGFKLPDLTQLASTIKDPWLVAAVAAWGLVALLVAVVYIPRKAQVSSLEPQVEKAKADSVHMARVLAQRAQMERQRNALLAEMQVVRDIDRDRYVWPHILDAVSKALPQYTWLIEVASRGGESDTAGATFTIRGETADPQALTRFMRTLAESPFLQNVTLVQSTLVSEQGHDVTAFTLNAQYRQPPMAILTMEPLAASVVQGVRSGGGARR